MKRTLISLFTAGLLLLAASQTVFAKSRYYGEHLCAYDGFKCIQVKRGQSWKKLFPNRVEREIVKRLNRTNMSLSYRNWIVVPENLKNISHLDLSPFPDYMDTGNKKLVLVKLDLHAFAAYGTDGYLVHWGPISGGKGYCSDINAACKTATGNYQIIQKKGPRCESSTFPIDEGGGAPMPYCMHYYKGFALHASNLPGYHASHGCIRLFKDDAKWLNRDFTDVGTEVIVTQ